MYLTASIAEAAFWCRTLHDPCFEQVSFELTVGVPCRSEEYGRDVGLQ